MAEALTDSMFRYEPAAADSCGENRLRLWPCEAYFYYYFAFSRGLLHAASGRT